MIRTVISRLIVWPLMLCVSLGITPASAAEPEQDVAPWSLTELMHILAQVTKSKATFVEHKHLSMLTTPLEFSGTLEYTAPGRLEKYTLLPKPESLILDQDKLVVQTGDAAGKRTLSLQDYPSVWAFIESIRSTLAGDVETLKRFYHVALKGQAKQWQLILQPADSKIKSLVSEILINGSFEQINTIEIRESGGDYSVMSISRDDS
jgi:hypothetical protein